VDQIFDFMVRDLSMFALQVHGKPSSTPDQMKHCMRMVRKPAVDLRRYEAVWNTHVYPLKDAYDLA